MLSMDDLRALLERVRAATGPDRELDRAVHDALGLPAGLVVHNGMIWNQYTASIDAALALVERVLPGWRLSQLRQLVERLGGRFKATVWDCEIEEINGHGQSDAEAVTAPLAILAALLTALVAQKDAPHDT